MSTLSQNKRPQLTLDDLYLVKWLLGGVLTLLAVWTVFYMDVEAWTLMGLTSVAAIAVLFRPTWPARVPGIVHTLAFPAIVIFFVADLWLKTEVLPAMVRLDILLLLYRSSSYRQRRDELQIIVLGLFLIVVAGVLTVSLVFAVQLLVYTACALAFLLAITLTEAAAGPAQKAFSPGTVGAPPGWAVHANWRQLFRRLRAVSDWRLVVLGGGLFAGVVAVSALLFLAIPRFQLENSMFLDRFVSKKAKSGFSDSIRFGDVTEIQQDTSVALSVDVSDQTKVPATPYWRMLVLDQYDNGTFKLSAGLRRQEFGPERTGAVVHGEARPRLGAAVYWTFYLESGLSRYLPLLGHFEVLQFRESQNFRLARDLVEVALRDEPVTMTAYRVESFDLSGALTDPRFAQRWRERALPGQARVAMQTRLVLNDSDHAALDRMLNEITGGAPLRAADFVDRTDAWLRKNHSYTLSPNIPRGDGDILVRWMSSREAGHCELFAGAFVLLARQAGFAAHVATGFKGGTWNAYSNNFTVRNSDAHAWAEIFDEGTEAWVRADPLGVSANAVVREAKGEAALAARLDRSWSARLDSLRVFWYRRIVSFDQQSQVETLKAVKEATENSGRKIRAAVAEALTSLKDWILAPWGVQRLVAVTGAVAMMAGLGWLWREFGRGWWRWLGSGRSGRREDPVRQQAGRWLAKFADGETPSSVVGELQRLRFGARESWSEPEEIFRRARQTLRAARRPGRVTIS